MELKMPWIIHLIMKNTNNTDCIICLDTVKNDMTSNMIAI